MSGVIAFCSRDGEVPVSFATSLARLLQQHPSPDVLADVIGNDVAAMRNKAVAAALDQDAEWLWFIDTDMVFPPTIVRHLLSHQVPVVQPIVLKRHPPHAPVLWTETPDEQDEKPVGTPRLVEVVTLGAGGTLYRTDVFRAVPAPWFEGIIGTEDVSCAKKIRAAGFPLYADLSAACGHLATVAVAPVYDPASGEWFIQYNTAVGATIRIPFIRKSRVIRPALELVR